MSDDDITYFAARAVRERQLAAQAAEPGIGNVHRQLADLYAAKTTQQDFEPLALRSAPNPARP